MMGEWRWTHAVLYPWACQGFVSRVLQERELGPATVTEESSVDEETRRSDVAFLEHEWYPDILDAVRNHVLQVNRETWTFDLDGSVAWQFTVYDGTVEGHYHAHIDTFLNDARPSCRKLSVMVNLSDGAGYEGGDFGFSPCVTRLPNDDVRKMGTAIVFPSFLEHSVSPVTKGMRYSLVGWFEGPNFR